MSTDTAREPGDVRGGPPQPRRFFYGWVILGAGTIAHGLNAAFGMLGLGVFFLPVQETFGVSKTALSGAFSLARLESALLGPVQGFLVDRFGARRIMFVGVGMLGAGFMLLGAAPNIVWFYVIFVGLIAVGLNIGLSSPVFATVVNWFVRRRTKALALVLSGTALGSVIVPGIGWSISEFGWERTAFMSGLFILAVGFPIAAVMRFRPEPYGYHPDGLPPEEPGPATAGVRTSLEGFTVRAALRSTSFWLINGCFALRMASTSAVPVHLVVFLVEDLEFSTERGAVYLGLIGLLGLGGRFAFGMLGDIAPKRFVLSAALLVQAASLAVLAAADGNALVVVALVLFATGHAGGGPTYLAIQGEYFGTRNYATISGFGSTVILVGGVSGPLIAGALADGFDDGYRYAWAGLAVAALVAGVILAFVRAPRRTRG